MAKILVSFPGRYGDILWALPTVRMIARHFYEPVSLAVAPKYGNPSFLRLLRGQDYVASVAAVEGWEVVESAPMSPREVPRDLLRQQWDYIIDLGYPGWPEGATLATSTFSTWRTWAFEHGVVVENMLDLSPWIVRKEFIVQRNVFVGWSEEWLELKMGLIANIAARLQPWQFNVIHPEGSRHGEWVVQRSESGEFYNMFRGLPNQYKLDFYAAAVEMSRSEFYFGCLSAQWVLANAMGKRCVVMEPAEARHHPVFWWEGNGNNNILVKGGDGKPTFDARHCVDEIRKVIAEIEGGRK